MAKCTKKNKCKRCRADRRRRDRLSRLTYGWSLWLGVQQTYHVTVSFVNEIERANKTDGVGSEERAAAAIVSGWPYRDLNMEFNRELFDDATDKELETLVLHELLHPLLFDVIKQVIDKRGMADEVLRRYNAAEESAVDLMAHYLMRLRPARGFDPETGRPRKREAKK